MPHVLLVDGIQRGLLQRKGTFDEPGFVGHGCDFLTLFSVSGVSVWYQLPQSPCSLVGQRVLSHISDESR